MLGAQPIFIIRRQNSKKLLEPTKLVSKYYPWPGQVRVGDIIIKYFKINNCLLTVATAKQLAQF